MQINVDPSTITHSLTLVLLYVAWIHPLISFYLIYFLSFLSYFLTVFLFVYIISIWIYRVQETMEETGSESASGDHEKSSKRRRRYNTKRKTVVNPDENFYFYWLMSLTMCILYNFWTLIVRQSFPELQVCILSFFSMCV